LRPTLAPALVVAACSSPAGTLAVTRRPALDVAMPAAAALATGTLEIHQINVQQGDCTPERILGVGEERKP
jgi:hypothetical protein